MPLSDELWRPISWSCRGGLAAGRLPPPWLTGSFSMLCSGALAPAWPMFSGWLEADSVQMASRLPMLQSDWLVSEASEEPDMLRSSPPADGQYEDEAAKTENKHLIISFINKTYEGSWYHYSCYFSPHNRNHLCELLKAFVSFILSGVEEGSLQ